MRPDTVHGLNRGDVAAKIESHGPRFLGEGVSWTPLLAMARAFSEHDSAEHTCQGICGAAFPAATMPDFHDGLRRLQERGGPLRFMAWLNRLSDIQCPRRAWPPNDPTPLTPLS